MLQINFPRKKLQQLPHGLFVTADVTVTVHKTNILLMLFCYALLCNIYWLRQQRKIAPNASRAGPKYYTTVVRLSSFYHHHVYWLKTHHSGKSLLALAVATQRKGGTIRYWLATAVLLMLTACLAQACLP